VSPNPVVLRPPCLCPKGRFTKITGQLVCAYKTCPPTEGSDNKSYLAGVKPVTTLKPLLLLVRRQFREIRRRLFFPAASSAWGDGA